MSGVMCHVSHVTCHILFYFSFSFFGQNCGASRWRVCYQRGLPRLVFTFGGCFLDLILILYKLKVFLQWCIDLGYCFYVPLLHHHLQFNHNIRSCVSNQIKPQILVFFFSSFHIVISFLGCRFVLILGCTFTRHASPCKILISKYYSFSIGLGNIGLKVSKSIKT